MWTDEALTYAHTNKVTIEEVAQALHAPEGLRFERRVEDLLIVIMGMAETGRVIVVVCEQADRTTTFRILRARALVNTELDEWRRRLL